MEKPGDSEAAKRGHGETSPTSTPAKKPRTETSPAVEANAASARSEPGETTLARDLPPDAVIEADDSASDAGYESDTASRASTSICSAVRDYEFENNRRYHRFKEGRYQFPNDEPEQEREDMKHAMVVHVCQGKLHFAPLENPQKILDIGTGTGIWAIDMGDEYPEAEILGIDLSPIQPQWVPPNVQFMVDDAEAEWMIPPDSLDYIHIRHMTSSIRDWPTLLSRAYTALKPGGWIELQELQFEVKCDDGTVREDNKVGDFFETMKRALVNFNVDLLAMRHNKRNVTDAGFVEVTEIPFKVPIGVWPRDPRMKMIGLYNRSMIHDALYGVARMTILSQEIAAKTKIITDHLTANGLDAASFDVDGLVEFPISQDDEEPYKARLDLIALTKELHDIALGPKEGLRYLAWDSIWEFKIADAVPLDGMISYEDLTAKVKELNNGLNLSLLDLRRLIRHAITNRLFVEPKKGFVAHSRSSQLIREDAPLRNWVGFMCNDLWLPIANVIPAMKKWPASEESTETGVNLAYKQDLPWFDFIQQDEVFTKRYNLAMQAHGGGEGYSIDTVIKGYPWGNLPQDSTVVDTYVKMGGNQGYISFALAESFPNLSFIVQDTAGMRAPDTIGKVPQSLQSRVQLTTHDFFTPQPVVAAAYFFRMIFHGFSDKYCLQILRALIPSLRRGAKVIINDGALPEPGTANYIEDRAMRTLDLFMQVTVNAREREPDDWRELFRRADDRFKFNDIWRPEKSRMWFIEAEWIGE
ncbi:s-adenosyl-l-methionine-dependent methyltransferase [Trichoderma arundinaceum]|uniref:S-adenosyl-l-methionine-dependent methyltransferase n=1 Tax=Trichoderma arundinaceum TaxID=490622 RepID=A0A395NRH6_TRIAR|nr:s-adenosyl-l-methionine-dependent methyltransferase [Trichoderma arundinaceum]